MPKRIFFLILVVVVCSWPAFGQDEGEKPKVELPDKVMSQVVRRIVQWYFKPADRPRVVHFSENGIQAAWMPTIRNIEFVLLNNNDSLRQEKGVYFFIHPERTGKTYSINFGFGDINCDATGDTWKFRILEGAVRLWRSGGWGNACGSGDNFGDATPIRGIAIGDVSPNELPGHEFFAKGKLKGIKLGFSRKEDIKKIFGSDCENTCSYDERWEFQADYYTEDDVSTTTETDNGVEKKTEYSPRPQYFGTLSSISLSPKAELSFSKVVFPRTFSEEWGGSVGDKFSSDGDFEGAVHTEIHSFTDGYGLTYNVFEKVTFINLPGDNKRKKGDLLSIECKIPDAVEKRSVLNGKPLR